MSAAASPSRFSIVIPTHSTRELTLRCLAAVASAGGTGLEVILIDDGSTDGTTDAVRATHPWVRVIGNPTAVGFTRAANQGVAAAAGDVLLLLNSDAEIEADALAVLEREVAAHPDLGIAGGALRYPDGSPQWSGGAQPSVLWFFALASGFAAWASRLPLYRRIRPVSASAGAETVDWVTGAAMAIRRQVWDAVGPFDERFVFYGQDLDLCMRARRAGWRVAVLSDLPVQHHHGGTIGSRQHLVLLFCDLLRWATKEHGARWAGWARRALATGASLRLLARRCASPFVGAAGRSDFDSLNREIASAAAALSAFVEQTVNLPGRF